MEYIVNNKIGFIRLLASCLALVFKTLVGNKGGYVIQHEHTIQITDDSPVMLTRANGFWD